MKIAILSCVLGNFDNPVDPVPQFLPVGWEVDFHRFTDKDFPQIADLPPRFQYRIPKLFGWEMFPDYNIYIWLDGSMSLPKGDSVQWLISKLGDNDMLFFDHPWRHSIKEEVDHIEEYLQKGNEYITSRYKNGLHKEQLLAVQDDEDYVDEVLLVSNVFVYRSNGNSLDALKRWWFYQSRYYTCDQVALPYALFASSARVAVESDNVFKCPYISLVSKHK